tara:strand:+ start:1537 stop:2433 length:897 start_codon:yes stop_codon:yes gene_type:complete
MIIENQEGLRFISEVESDSVDLVLVDPPYITSRDSGMDKWVDWVAKQDAEGAKDVRTGTQWKDYLRENIKVGSWFAKYPYDMRKKLKTFKERKANFMKYGSIYGKKYAVRTNYGEWDSDFTLENLEDFVRQFHRVLRKGGSCIVFFDIWKITDLKNILEGANFKQLRFIEWIKTNPQPINSQRNYLTNCREIALSAVKGGSSTFNSSYDNGIYKFPISGGKHRFHPTQKSLPLFEELVKKHSDEGDTVLDCFLGSGTTAVAAIKNNRKFIGCELDKEFFSKSLKRIEEETGMAMESKE